MYEHPWADCLREPLHWSVRNYVLSCTDTSKQSVHAGGLYTKIKSICVTHGELSCGYGLRM